MIYTIPEALANRLRPLIPASIPLYTQRATVDMVSEGQPPVAVAIRFIRPAPVRQLPGAVMAYDVEIAFIVLVDEGRATPADLARAESIYTAALQSLVEWEIAPGRMTRFSDGPAPDDEAGVALFSFGVVVPTFITSTP
ncbi:MAG TPA: hypothetical protein PKE01_05190 [Rhodocyclaceae bacterium]|uniref:hypothetical protein n=1 Tax=Zoogloea sp. TaxID=49181 RepID=UPI002B7A1F06|nr:hypothetical protein [Zoogloea sp.]HMV62705.1 hypothetical protein [Rhodocyclaceae bacterium]HMY98121.1 hypothetical protein [Burkholderiaceae bacterium]HNH16406.1 hypothetical protein [Zoogloea sp.]